MGGFIEASSSRQEEEVPLKRNRWCRKYCPFMSSVSAVLCTKKTGISTLTDS
jgi:hypothetical protein